MCRERKFYIVIEVNTQRVYIHIHIKEIVMYNSFALNVFM